MRYRYSLNLKIERLSNVLTSPYLILTRFGTSVVVLALTWALSLPLTTVRNT